MWSISSTWECTPTRHKKLHPQEYLIIDVHGSKFTRLRKYKPRNPKRSGHLFQWLGHCIPHPSSRVQVPIWLPIPASCGHTPWEGTGGKSHSWVPGRDNELQTPDFSPGCYCRQMRNELMDGRVLSLKEILQLILTNTGWWISIQGNENVLKIVKIAAHLWEHIKKHPILHIR